VRYFANFDDSINSMFLLFEMTTTEGWIDVMHRGVDATSIDWAPVENNAEWRKILFMLFTIFGSLFILNLFLEVVVSTFDD